MKTSNTFMHSRQQNRTIYGADNLGAALYSFACAQGALKSTEQGEAQPRKHTRASCPGQLRRINSLARIQRATLVDEWRMGTSPAGANKKRTHGLYLWGSRPDLISGLVLTFTVILFVGLVWSEEKDKKEKITLPPGMEIKKFGDIGILAPKDSQVYMQDNRVAAESAIEYAARKFIETREHFAKLETEIEGLKKELGELKKAVLELREEKNNQQAALPIASQQDQAQPAPNYP